MKLKPKIMYTATVCNLFIQFIYSTFNLFIKYPFACAENLKLNRGIYTVHAFEDKF